MSELCHEVFLDVAKRVSERARHVKHVNPDKSGLGTPSALWEGIAVHHSAQTPYDPGDTIRIGLTEEDGLRCIWIGTAVKTKRGVTLKPEIFNPHEAIEYIQQKLDAALK